MRDSRLGRPSTWEPGDGELATVGAASTSSNSGAESVGIGRKQCGRQLQRRSEKAAHIQVQAAGSIQTARPPSPGGAQGHPTPCHVTTQRWSRHNGAVRAPQALEAPIALRQGSAPQQLVQLFLSCCLHVPPPPPVTAAAGWALPPNNPFQPSLCCNCATCCSGAWPALFRQGGHGIWSGGTLKSAGGGCLPPAASYKREGHACERCALGSCCRGPPL